MTLPCFPLIVLDHLVSSLARTSPPPTVFSVSFKFDSITAFDTVETILQGAERVRQY